jgi:hypothetical protein
MLDGVPAAIQDAIRAVQPYRRKRRNEALWILHDLWLQDKHKTIEVVQSVAAGWMITDAAHVSDLRTIPGPFKDGDVIGAYRASRPQARMHHDVPVFFSIALDKKGPGRGFPLTGVLQSAQEQVVQIVLTLKGLAQKP